jgi:hypothetical protein
MSSGKSTMQLPAGNVTAKNLCAALRELVEAQPEAGTLRSIRIATATARLRGARLFRQLETGREGWRVVERLIDKAMAKAAKADRYPDCFQIEIGWQPVRMTAADLQAVPRSQIGRRGLAVFQGTSLLGVAGAGEMIAANRNYERALEKLLQTLKLPPDSLETAVIEPGLFNSLQLLLRLDGAPRLELLWRGNRVVEAAAVNAAGVGDLADKMILWMHNQVDGGGRIVYKYYPSAGSESSGDNTIRQAMATVCLNRIALRSGSSADRDIADRNLGHLLRKYYRRSNTLGFIAEGEKAKLGAAALAGLAIQENPGRANYLEPLDSLARTVDFLWQDSGEFRTFLKPEDRNDNQNFYPGEALLFWAVRLADAAGGGDPTRFLQSFAFYRDSHRANRNPAFVPWHTQAYYTALPAVGAAAASLKEFIFEMNDWLLDMQQWDGDLHPDLKGRFYNPRHPEYGPPHASSTGVYLEGLIDAFDLARQQGDTDRAARYRLAILRGLRSLIQLQFRDETDMYYVARRERVLGGIRTEVYDNTIRVDNVQHGLMAILKILARMSPEELRLGR